MRAARLLPALMFAAALGCGAELVEPLKDPCYIGSPPSTDQTTNEPIQMPVQPTLPGEAQEGCALSESDPQNAVIPPGPATRPPFRDVPQPQQP